jgi:hypothetical protein
MEVRDTVQDTAADQASRCERLHDLLALQARLRPRDLACSTARGAIPGR